MFVNNGTLLLAHMGKGARSVMCAGRALRQVNLVSLTKLLHMTTMQLGEGQMNSGFNPSSLSCLTSSRDVRSWTAKEFIEAHSAVRLSGKFNFEGCRIPIPTAIRYDRMEAAVKVRTHINIFGDM